jgi:8-oxo-dGTP pyrophosphatase MutT (NUDIX family)
MESRNITQGVGALIYAKDTKRYLFLLRQGGSWSLTWALPGGKVDAGETVVVGLAREIEEELGGRIRDPKLVPIEKYTSDNFRFIYHTFFIGVDYEFIPLLNDEHIGYAWLPLSAAPRPLHPGIVRTLNAQEVVAKIALAEQYC